VIMLLDLSVMLLVGATVTTHVLLLLLLNRVEKYFPSVVVDNLSYVFVDMCSRFQSLARMQNGDWKCKTRRIQWWD